MYYEIVEKKLLATGEQKRTVRFIDRDSIVTRKSLLLNDLKKRKKKENKKERKVVKNIYHVRNIKFHYNAATNELISS